MDNFHGIPDDVAEAAAFVKKMKEKQIQTRAEKELLNQAKLKIAYWALGTESVPASRENLTYVLGGDAKEIMENYDKALAKEQEENPKRSKTSKTTKRDKDFWDNA